MKIYTLMIIVSISFCCNNNSETKISELSNHDDKSKELLNKLTTAQNNLKEANNEISDLLTGSGKYEKEICTIGSNCNEHSKLYKKRDSLELIYNEINLLFQNELANASIEFRKSYYLPILKKSEADLDSAKANIIYLESGTNGFDKCTIGSNCVRHKEFYTNRDANQKHVDSIKKLLNDIN